MLCSLMNRFILPLQQLMNPAFFFYFFIFISQFPLQWDKNTGNVVGMFFSFFFFPSPLSLKPDYFTCQSTILGKEEISKKGSVLSQSSKQKEQQKSFTPE